MENAEKNMEIKNLQMEIKNLRELLNQQSKESEGQGSQQQQQPPQQQQQQQQQLSQKERMKTDFLSKKYII